MRDTIVAVISSSAFVGIISLLFNWVQNRKSNSLNYITEERKKWREKIRNIATGIEKSKFKGKKEKSIEQYLIQLEMNINPYGRNKQSDYRNDGHIWNAIEAIRESDNEGKFKQSKKLLLAYLSLLLKTDWEKSKSEVRGYSNIIKYIMLYGGLVIVLTIYYFGILNLKDMLLYIAIIIANGIPIVVVKFYYIDEMNELSHQRKLLTIKEIMHNKKKIKKKNRGFFLITAIYMLVLMAILYFTIPSAVANNIKYCVDENNNVCFYTNINEYFFVNIEEALEKEVGKSVVKLEIDKLITENHDYDNEIKSVIRDYMMIPNNIVFGFTFGMFAYVLYLIVTESSKYKKMEKEIEDTEYLICKEYEEDKKNIVLIIEEVIYKNGEQENSKDLDELLGLAQKILGHMKRFVWIKITDMDNKVKSIERIRYRNEIQNGYELMKKSEKLIEKFQKNTKKEEKIKLLQKLKANLEQVAEIDIGIGGYIYSESNKNREGGC